ncbi:MAG: c-type cytochrome [Methylococcales bacterium]|nr:c-type cytochrome [Methylococcales bacterium]
MRIVLLLLSLMASGAVLAAPSSQVAWTPDAVNAVKQGNAQHGQELAATCAACHGDNGIASLPDTPSLAGQKATYLYKQLTDYANGDREHAMMNALAQGLSDTDKADLAAWYAAQAAPVTTRNSLLKSKQAQLLANQGDKARALAPCSVCHGDQGEGGEIDIPALAGQSASYLAATLNAYRNGQRGNDLYQRMRTITAKLTDKEIKALAEYYQALD